MSADTTVARTLRAPRTRPWSRFMGLGSVYAKTVRDSRRTAIVVGGIGGLLMLATAAPYGTEFTTPESRATLIAQMGSLPAVFRGLLGDPINIDTLGGWLSFRAGNFLPVLLGLWPVLALSGTLAGEASKGSLDLLASTPVSRRSIALQKLAGHVTALAFAMVLIAFLTYLASATLATFPEDRFGIDQAFGFALLTGLLILACGSASFAVAPMVGRTRAVAVGLIVLFGGYIVSSYGTLSSFLDSLGVLSWFDWTAGHRPLAGVTDWAPVGLLAVVTVALLAVGVVAFERRDLGQAGGLSWLRLPSLPAGVRGPFTRQLADRLGLAIVWGAALGLYAALIAASSAQFSEAIGGIPQIRDYLNTLFPDIDLLQPSGLLQLAFFSFGSVVMGLAAATALAGWASDEGDRRLEVVLAAPVSRASWFLRSGLGVFAAIAVTTIVLAVMVGLATALADGNAVDVGLGAAILGLAAAAFAGVGLAVGGLARSSLAAPVAGLLVLGTFLLETIGAFLDLPDVVLELSLYKHLGQPMAGVFDPVGIMAALVLAAGGLLVGAWGMQRRDVGK